MSDSNNDQTNVDASVSTFVSSVVFAVGVTAALFIAFSILYRLLPRVYAPKTYMGPDRERLDKPSRALCGWVLGGRSIDNVEFVERCGLDAYMFLDFLVATLVVCMMGVRQYIRKRQRFILTPHHSQTLQATTILVCGIPKDEQTIQSLFGVFNVFPGGVKRIWPAYSAKHLDEDITKRKVLTNKLETAECALIRTELKHHAQNDNDAGRRPSDGSTANILENQQESRQPLPAEKRPQHRPANFPMTLFASCCGANKVDSVSTYRNELVDLNNSIVTRQQAGIAAMHENEEENKLSAAFIQFNSQLGAHFATQAVIHSKTLTMQPRHLEVHPTDVLWGNLGESLKQRTVRKVIAAGLTLALIVLWSIPVTFVASIAKLDAIVRYAPWLSGVYKLPKVALGIIQGILPPIGLALLMMVLPIILYKLSYLGGAVLRSRQALTVATAYHWFSVVHVLLVTTLANGIFAAVKQIMDNPNNVMNMLAASLPKASTFFLSFILLSFIQIPLMMLQIGPLIMYFVGKFSAKTPRQAYAAERTMGFVDWGTTIPPHTIAFSIGLIYSTIQPIILPIMVFYFGMYFLAFRYMFIYVYHQPFDSGGLIYPRIIDQIYVGLIIFEIVMLGLFILQKAAGQSVILFIVLLASIAAIVVSRNKVFKPLIKFLPVEAIDTAMLQEQGQSLRNNHVGNESHNATKEEITEAGTTSAPTGHHGIGNTDGPSTLAFNPTPNEKGVTDSMAFVNPSLRAQMQPIWLPKDVGGFVNKEIEELNVLGLPNTTESATMDAKGKVAVEVSQQIAAPGDEFWE
ncbi:hypothetical protein FBU30_000590 [Linnemannia zychae]|nr:hypothetical protein FBU30_000590 [Linnemannia zychae]